MNSIKCLILNKQGICFGQNYIGQGRKVPVTQGGSLKSLEIVMKSGQSWDYRIKRHQLVLLKFKMEKKKKELLNRGEMT